MLLPEKRQQTIHSLHYFAGFRVTLEALLALFRTGACSAWEIVPDATVTELHPIFPEITTNFKCQTCHHYLHELNTCHVKKQSLTCMATVTEEGGVSEHYILKNPIAGHIFQEQYPTQDKPHRHVNTMSFGKN